MSASARVAGVGMIPFVKPGANAPYLDMVRDKFGPETVAHIREMTSHRLERTYA